MTFGLLIVVAAWLQDCAMHRLDRFHRRRNWRNWRNRCIVERSVGGSVTASKIVSGCPILYCVVIRSSASSIQPLVTYIRAGVLQC